MGVGAGLVEGLDDRGPHASLRTCLGRLGLAFGRLLLPLPTELHLRAPHDVLGILLSDGVLKIRVQSLGILGRLLRILPTLPLHVGVGHGQLRGRLRTDVVELLGELPGFLGSLQRGVAVVVHQVQGGQLEQSPGLAGEIPEALPRRGGQQGEIQGVLENLRRRRHAAVGGFAHDRLMHVHEGLEHEGLALVVAVPLADLQRLAALAERGLLPRALRQQRGACDLEGLRFS
mmetsp:Transcript_77290/g.250170  ORF Transcript_77290/g.250170 Transcript_77290/m.250170 type:complete len:231 (+) Transcript_77290:517-1209(+)